MRKHKNLVCIWYFMKFTQEELDSIINDYNNGMTPKEMSIKYNRNSGTIIGKLQNLGIYKNTKYRFTKEDIEFLKEYYPLGDYDAIFKRFPNATTQSIQAYCSKHKITADYYNDKKWTDKELGILEKYYYPNAIDRAESVGDGVDSFYVAPLTEIGDTLYQIES